MRGFRVTVAQIGRACLFRPNLLRGCGRMALALATPRISTVLAAAETLGITICDQVKNRLS
jgi:hypothetical protein